MIVDREPEVVHGNPFVARDPLLQKRANLDRPRLTRRENLDDLLKRLARVDDVLDDDDLLAGDVGGKVPQQANVAGGLGPLPVGGNLQEVERDGSLLELLGEIAKEEDRSLQDPDQKNRTAFLISLDLRREARDSIFERFRIDQGAAELHGLEASVWGRRIAASACFRRKRPQKRGKPGARIEAPGRLQSNVS